MRCIAAVNARPPWSVQRDQMALLLDLLPGVLSLVVRVVFLLCRKLCPTDRTPDRLLFFVMLHSAHLLPVVLFTLFDRSNTVEKITMIPSGQTILGMDQTTALIIGVVVVLVIVVALVTLSNGSHGRVATR